MVGTLHNRVSMKCRNSENFIQSQAEGQEGSIFDKRNHVSVSVNVGTVSVSHPKTRGTEKKHQAGDIFRRFGFKIRFLRIF